VFPNDLAPLPHVATWIKASIVVAFNDEDIIDKNIMHIMSMPPTLDAMSYRAMYACNNHIRVASAKEHLTTSDCGVMATFEQKCISGPNDQKLVLAKLEYVGRVEEILELNYGCST
jgi:hypothetical protein